MLKTIGWVAALSLLLGIGLGSEAQAKSFEQRIAGGIGWTARGDGQDAFLILTGVLLGKGGPGSAQIRVEIEAGLPIGPPTDCPAGFDIRQPIVASNFVTTFNDLSLLSGGQGTGFACLDVQTGNIFAVVGGAITGGNGRFEGATGTWETTGLAEPAGFPPGLPLSAVSYRVTGTTVYDLD